MIIKHFNLKKNLDKKINFYLLYGKNIGLIEETINNILKPNFSKNIYYYDESDILSDLDNFKEQILNNSLFENNKLIIINRATDKILEIIEELSEKKIQEIKIIIKSGILEKKSKLRTYFEKKDEFVIIPFYEDDNQTLMLIAQNFFRQNKIKINQENINFIVRKCVGNRIVLQSELEKIYNYAHKKLKKGGDLIGKGAYGCVFNVEFPCRNKRTIKFGYSFSRKCRFANGFNDGKTTEIKISLLCTLIFIVSLSIFFRL